MIRLHDLESNFDEKEVYKIVNDCLKSKPYSGTFEAREKKKPSNTRCFSKFFWKRSGLVI